MYIQLPDEASMDKLGSHLDSLGVEKKGCYIRGDFHTIRFPVYYKVRDDLSFQSWQSFNISDGNWSGTKYEDYYNSGIPLDAILYPQDYPEYYI